MLGLARLQQDVTGLYKPTSPTSSVDIAASAYANAVQFFEQELTDDERKRDWIRSQTSMNDVCQVVNQAKRRYENGSDKNKKARKWVNALASSITYYGGVIDTVVQYDPAHAGLAWGALKFVFSGVLNHAELVSELSKALTKVAEALPRVQVDATLYQTPWMKEAMSRLYAYILLFLQKAVKWYTMSSARRAVSSILSPYSLSFKDTIEEIRKCTESVDAIASTSGRAEIRGLTIALEGQAEKLKESDRKLHDMQARMNELQASSQRTEAVVVQVLQVAINNHDLTHAIKLDTADSRARICDIQFSQILSVLSSDRTPEDVFQICQSFAKRRPSWRQPGRDTAILVQRLSDWVFMAGSSMFLVQAGSRAETRTKDLVVEVTGLLKSTTYPVFWYLSEPIGTHSTSTLNNILKNLIFQVLSHDSNIISQDDRLGNITAFQGEHKLAEWISLLCLVFSKIKQCFVVVETEDLYRIAGRDGAQVQKILETFDQIFDSITATGSILKLLIVSYGARANLSKSSGNPPRIVANVNPPLPASRRSKQHMTPQFRTGLGRHNLQPRLISARR